MEIGTIVGRGFPPRADIVPSDLPAGRAAHFLLKGSFEGMPGAWQILSLPQTRSPGHAAVSHVNVHGVTAPPS